MVVRSPVTVGIIGVGSMGLAIAERLMAAGMAVNGYRRGSLDAFRSIGGIAMQSAAAVAAASDFVILLLPSDVALLKVANQIAASLRPSQVVACLSSHPIESKQAAAAIAGLAGAVLLDGEVSGTPSMLRAGQASVLVAGDAAAIDFCRPLLQAIGSTTCLSTFGDAARMKLIANYLVGVHTLAAADALIMGNRLGLDPQAVVDAIGKSAGASRMLEVRGRAMAQRQFDAGDLEGYMRFFELLRNALEQRDARGGPLLDLTEELYRRTIDAGYGGKDLAAIHDALESNFAALSIAAVP